jgi:transposase-like protein
MRRRPVVLKELGLVEQRYQAVREVLTDGASVTDVARRNGVSRQTVHEWLVKYANQGPCRVDGSLEQAAVVPPSDEPGGRGAHHRAAP